MVSKGKNYLLPTSREPLVSHPSNLHFQLDKRLPYCSVVR
uniref:Uncharacterized protein n=1 Tax=Utricularia reniformis TaxID=192314 RepID=A0A1Y0B4R6_9LAMI|nr:hypothetical protein AEK19_MT2258 [Utricularia reniformis]ART32402.1 hypothetical protein AEK19_MT2258 [Utricularia reniformis]